MADLTISVICASRNEEKDILDLCQSFINQEYQNKELIIIDDSSDNTKEVVKNFISKASVDNIIVLNGIAEGCCPARNIGVKSSKGDIICYMTADSYFPNNGYLTHINTVFDSDIDTYMPNSLVANQDNLYADFIHCWQQEKFKLRGENYSPLTSQGYCVRKSAALSVGLIDTIEHKKVPFNVCRDWTLVTKMDTKGFKKVFDKSYFVPHTAPADYDDFFWTHMQRGVISGGYNLYFREKGKIRLLIESVLKVFKSLFFYLTIFLPLKRAVTLKKYSTHKRSIFDFLKCDIIKTFSFHYGELSVVFK